MVTFKYPRPSDENDAAFKCEEELRNAVAKLLDELLPTLESKYGLNFDTVTRTCSTVLFCMAVSLQTMDDKPSQSEFEQLVLHCVFLITGAVFTDNAPKERDPN